MAIQNSLLFGPGTTGTIGKQITMYPLKGQQVARLRVRPTNPNTLKQQTQRGLMKSAVADFQTGGLSTDDRTALNRWASAAFQTESGYNRFTAERIRWYKDGVDTALVKNVTASYSAPTQATVYCDLLSGSSATIYFGISKTSQPNTQVMSDDTGDAFSAILTGLVVGITYYFYIEFKDALAAQTMRTGLYEYLHEA